MMQRSLLIFQNSVKSQETARGYTWYLDKFKEFYKLKDYDSMVTIPQGKEPSFVGMAKDMYK